MPFQPVTIIAGQNPLVQLVKSLRRQKRITLVDRLVASGSTG